MALLAELPFFEPIVEDELHLLRSCVLYDNIRTNLSTRAMTAILGPVDKIFEADKITCEIANYIKKAFNLRFPEDAPNNSSSACGDRKPKKVWPKWTGPSDVINPSSET